MARAGALVVALAGVFLAACAADDDAAVASMLVPELAGAIPGSAVRARLRLGLTAPECAAAAGPAFWDAIDLDRSATVRDGAYVVVRAGRKLARLAIRTYSDHGPRVEPGARLGAVLGVRVRLARRPAQPAAVRP